MRAYIVFLLSSLKKCYASSYLFDNTNDMGDGTSSSEVQICKVRHNQHRSVIEYVHNDPIITTNPYEPVI